MADFSPITLARFWGRVSVGADFQCWEWTGTQNGHGYGRFGNELTPAHRLAYELVNGAIPDGLVVRHRCDNRLCCNPRHLEVGTHADNSGDAVERGRTARGSNHGRSKLTDAEAAYIKVNPDKLPLSTLAERFRIGMATASYIRSGRSWKYLQGEEMRALCAQYQEAGIAESLTGYGAAGQDRTVGLSLTKDKPHKE